MKYLQRSALLLIIFVGSVAFCFAQSDNQPPPPVIEYNENAWIESSSTVGRFSILMPGKPTLTTEQVETEAGTISNNALRLSTKAAEYAVNFADAPIRLDEPETVKLGLNASRDSILAADRSMILLSETEVDLNGQVGREWLFQKGRAIIRARAFIINGRFYQIGITTPQNVAFKTGQPSGDPQDRTDFYETTSTKFLNSFKLITYDSAEVDRYLAKEQVMGKAAENSTGPIIRGGILNGKATSLPSPVYPPIARAARATGRVTVKIIVDEEGKVVAAQVESGHPLLQQAALKAAREAQFAPTRLNGQPVKVFGILTYNFVSK